MRSLAPVSVVISSFQEGDALAGTIASVEGAAVTPREIIIVDDGSSDGSCERDWPFHVRVVRQEHVGVAAARNRGTRDATQPVVVFLDAHCTVDSFWLKPLLDALDHAPDALVGPAVRDARHPCFIGCGGEIVDARFTYRWRQVIAGGLTDLGLVPGGCFAVRRDHFLEAGGFAPFSGFGLEDVELALRWWRAGHFLFGVPESVVTHSFRTNPPYPPDYQAWLQNILRTALWHLTGQRLHACVTACAQFPAFASAIAVVLAESWIPTCQRLSATEVRPVADYFDQWGPKAFGHGSRRS